jgi:hypothetical protein
MLELLILFGVLFIILIFFYKQAICEFRINQIEWSQNDTLLGLLHEKVPLVVRTLPPSTFWTASDVLSRPCYADLPIFQDQTVPQWLSAAGEGAGCPWKYPQAEKIATVSGLPIWAKKWLNPVIIHPLLRWWMYPRYHCWAGKMGLQRTFATWTCILPMEGEIMVTIMPETMDAFLPHPWVGCVPSELTAKDTPFLQDLKFMDIVLRPGSALFLPAHWFMAWVPRDPATIPMVCTVSYHTPISLLAFHSSPFTA